MDKYNLYSKSVGQPQSFYSNNEKKPKEDVMQNAIKQLSKLIELGGVPEYGSYTPIKIDFTVDNEILNASDVILSVSPSILLDERPKERELNIKVFSKDKYHSYSQTLYRGEKQQILNKLRNENLNEEINNFIDLASEKFNEL